MTTVYVEKELSPDPEVIQGIHPPTLAHSCDAKFYWLHKKLFLPYFAYALLFEPAVHWEDADFVAS